MAISAYFGHQGSMLEWQGMRVYPSYGVSYGNDVLVQHALDWFAVGQDRPPRSLEEASTRGLVLLLGDCWTFNAPLLPQLATAAWTPVDHLAPPAVVLDWFRWTGAVPLAMSRFGQASLEEAGLDSLYVPHGIETSTFYPGDREQARERVGLPGDAFVIAIVAANVGRDLSRKCFADQIAAFARLRARHSDALLVLHTDVDSPVGVRLRLLLESMLPQGSYVYADQYGYRKGIPAAAVADVYRAADVLSNCSMGEGFGLPIVEAQACGTPVIVTDATAMPELCGAGWKVPYEPTWHDIQGGWAAKPLISGIAEAYEEAYRTAGNLRHAAAAFGQSYDADLIALEHWGPALERLEEGLRGRAAALRSPAAGPERLVLADGLWWVDRGRRTDDGIGHQPHEAELAPILEGLLPDGGTLLDVGAHVGHWTLRLARSRAARVVAVEANPATARTLRRHIAMNDLDDQVRVVEVAAWDGRAWLRLEDENGKLEGGSTRVLEVGEDLEATAAADLVPARRLDEVIGRDGHLAGRLDLVKVDVEGADLRALRGMAGLLEAYRPTLFIERHDIYGYYALEELEALLEDLGYDHRPAGPDGLASLYLIASPRDSEEEHHADEGQAAVRG